MNYSPIALAILSISLMPLAGCSKKTEAKTAEASLSSALSPEKAGEAVQQARLSNLPQADASTPLASYYPLNSGNDLMFMYYAMSGIPPEIDKIAEKYSSEYRQSSDAFRKQDLLTALKPRIEGELATGKTRHYFSYDIEQSLKHYDFAKKQFPLSSGLRPDALWYMNDNSDYKLDFTNAGSFQQINVADETKARAIEKMVGGYQSFVLRLYAFAQDVDINKTHLKAQIVKVSLLDKQGNELVAQ